jgi:O-antigen ligase
VTSDSRLRGALFPLLVFLSLAFPSVTAGYAALFLLAVLWFAEGIATRGLPARLARVPAVPVLAVFCVLGVASAMASPTPEASLSSLRWFSLLLILPIAADLMETPGKARGILLGVALAGTVEASVGLIQYFRGGDDLANRIRGSFSHYMTFSGVTMIAAAILLGLALEERGRRRLLMLAAAILPGAATLLTFTRGAYLGLLAGAIAVLALRRPRGLLLLPAVVAAILLLSPANLRERIVSISTLQDATSRERVAMARAGRAMIADTPWLGVGPERVAAVYPRYRVPEAIESEIAHLHNNVLQVAAELGIPAAAAYLAFLGVTLWAAAARLRGCPRGDPAAGPLSAALLVGTAVAVGGVFEYNLGDAEVLVPTLLAVAVPFALGARFTGSGEGAPRA